MKNYVNNRFKIFKLIVFCVFIFYSENLSSQVLDPRLDKFIIVNEWVGTMSVRINWTRDLIGTATVTGTVNMKKSYNQGLNLSWGTITPDNSDTWNWEVEYTIDYMSGNCHYTRNDRGKFLAAVYINPVNYSYSFAFLDPGVPVTVICPDGTVEDIIHIVYDMETRHLRLDLDTLLLKGNISYTDTEAREENREMFDSYKDSMVNRLNRNLEILDSFHIQVPEIEEMENNDPDETGAVNYEVTWELTPKTENTQITLHEVDKNWYPSENGTISTYVEWNPAVQPVAVRFTLYDITNEKGYCLNSVEKQETLDITFDSAWSSENHFELDSIEGIPNSMTATLRSLNLTGRQEVRLKSYDYGGWAKLKVELMFENTWVPSDNLPYTTIPFDQDEDKIADKWEDDYGVQTLAPDWDEETGNGHTQPGDGLTLYEEYRGFFILPGNTFKRTDPNIKDIFVIDYDGLFPPDVWKYTSGMNGYRVENSMTKNEGGPKESRIVDFNDGYAKNNHKYAARLVAIKIEGDTRDRIDSTKSLYGMAKSNDGPRAESPKDCDSTLVFTANISFDIHNITAVIYKMMTKFTDEQINDSAHMSRSQCENLYRIFYNEAALEAAVKFYIMATVFHELGHTCGVIHHDENQPYVGEYLCPMRYKDSYTELLILQYTIIDILDFISSMQVVDISGIVNKFTVLKFCDSQFNCYSQLYVKDD